MVGDFELGHGEKTISSDEARKIAREFLAKFASSEGYNWAPAEGGRLTSIDFAQDPDPLTAPWEQLLERDDTPEELPF